MTSDRKWGEKGLEEYEETEMDRQKWMKGKTAGRAGGQTGRQTDKQRQTDR
jgi:hypothetical protein